MISQLHHALSDLKIDEVTHEWVKRAGKFPAYVVELDGEGFPMSMRLRTAANAFWRIEASNHRIFPAFKTEPEKSRKKML